MDCIEINHLTKDYGNSKGIFDISLSIPKGEMFGYVGNNGAGKTTTFRHILGFSRPDKGSAKVKGLDSWKKSSEIMKYIGYVPGDIAFPDLRSGTDVIKSQAEFLNLKDLSYANNLIKKLQLDVRGNPRTMSKGMKQKLAIVLALMNNPEILILDEPTTGLDPLMRDTFMELIEEEHQKGKTIMISSHMFEELETTCDRVGLIMNGRLIDIADMNKIRNVDFRLYKIAFINKEDLERFKQGKFEITREQPEFNQVTVKILEKSVRELFIELNKYKLEYFTETKYNLEKYFKEIFKRELGGNYDK